MPESLDLLDLLPSWSRSLRARNRTPATIRSYLESGRMFAAFLGERGLPTRIDAITPGHVDAFTANLLDTRSAATARLRWRSLQQFFKWAVSEGEIERSPMENLGIPTGEEKVVDAVPAAQVRALIEASKGRGFSDIRDTGNPDVDVRYRCAARRGGRHQRGRRQPRL